MGYSNRADNGSYDVNLLLSKGSSHVPGAFQHWAICIEGFCFEVMDDGLSGCAFHDWVERYPDWESRKIGVTRESWSKLAVTAIKIWVERFPDEYHLTTSNCQNFCHCFYTAIRVDEDDPEISNAEFDTWEPLPHRLTSVFKGIGDCAMAGMFVSASGIAPSLSIPMAGAAAVVSHLIKMRLTKDKKYEEISKLPCTKDGLRVFGQKTKSRLKVLRGKRRLTSAEEGEKARLKGALVLVETFQGARSRLEEYRRAQEALQTSSDDYDDDASDFQGAAEGENRNENVGEWSSEDECRWSERYWDSDRRRVTRYRHVGGEYEYDDDPVDDDYRTDPESKIA